MGFWGFFLATGIGQLPATIVYSYVGGMLTGGTKTFVYALMIIFSLAALAFLIKKVYTCLLYTSWHNQIPSKILIFHLSLK